MINLVVSFHSIASKKAFLANNKTAAGFVSREGRAAVEIAVSDMAVVELFKDAKHVYQITAGSAGAVIDVDTDVIFRS